jgi:hypothetical protein
MDEHAEVAMLDDVARGLVNDDFQRQFLVRQRFKGYVNWFFKVVEYAAWNGLTWRI